MIVITGLGQMLTPDGMTTSSGGSASPTTNRASKVYATAAATRYGGGIDYPDPYVQSDRPPQPIVEPTVPSASTPPIPQPPAPQPDLPSPPQPDLPNPPSAGARVVIDTEGATRTCPDGSVVHVAAACPTVPTKIIGLSPRGKKIALVVGGVVLVGGLIAVLSRD